VAETTAPLVGLALIVLLLACMVRLHFFTVNTRAAYIDLTGAIHGLDLR
jgi:hypothetical protein